ncbi:MAG: peptidylprolyl isomerase [Proteobacteria bacterium]|nr:peptidylprolyl isomerase [Pseudomonadota bacterium]
MKSILFILLTIITISASAQIVRMETVMGNIDIELHPDVAPNTVANFLNYVNNGAYDNSFFHRSLRGFVIQGGALAIVDGSQVLVAANDPVANEYSLPNKRGTIAMTQLSDNLDSAANQWFFNILDNSATLGPPSTNRFTVFGTVVKGMEVVDSINTLQTWNFGNILSDLPLINYISGSYLNNVALINSVYVYEEPFNMNIGINGAWYNQDTSGQGILIELLPRQDTNDLAFMAWFTFDTQQPDESITANIGNAGHRWMTGLGEVDTANNSITFDLTLTSGGLFDNELDVTNTVIAGSMTMTFTDCANATVTYDLTEQELSGSFSVIRVTSDIELCKNQSRLVQ